MPYVPARQAASCRGQDLETQRRRAAVAGHRHLGDFRGWRSFAAAPQHLVDACAGAAEQRLDRAAAPVPHPAAKLQGPAVRSVQAR